MSSTLLQYQISMPAEHVATAKPFCTQAMQACLNVHSQTQKSKGSRKANKQEAESKYSLTVIANNF